MVLVAGFVWGLLLLILFGVWPALRCTSVDIRSLVSSAQCPRNRIADYTTFSSAGRYVHPWHADGAAACVAAVHAKAARASSAPLRVGHCKGSGAHRSQRFPTTNAPSADMDIVAADPVIASAAITTGLPVRGMAPMAMIRLAGEGQDAGIQAQVIQGTARMFGLFQLQLNRGAFPSENAWRDVTTRAVVNEALARALRSDADVLGRRFPSPICPVDLGVSSRSPHRRRWTCRGSGKESPGHF